MIKRRRKNPHVDNKYLNELARAIYSGNGYALSSLLVYYNQGEKCDDCGEEFYNCLCEKCDDCGYPRCLCNLKFTDEKYIDEQIRKSAWELAKNTLDNKQLYKLTDFIFDYINQKGKIASNFLNKIMKITYKLNEIPNSEWNDEYLDELRKI